MTRHAWLTSDTVATTDFICRRLRIPNDQQLITAVNGALTSLIEEWNWEQFGTATPAETARLMFTMYTEYLESDACMIGTIHEYATTSPPPGCLPCDGTEYDREDYPRLYALLPANLIVDADHFVTPDLRDVFLVGAGGALAAFDTGGESEVILTEAQLAIHSHTDAGHSHTVHSHLVAPVLAPGELPVNIGNPIPGATGIGSANIQPSGGDQPHNNMPPYYALPRCIVAT